MRLLHGISDLSFSFGVTNGLTKLNTPHATSSNFSCGDAECALKLRAILLQSRNNGGRYLINRGEIETRQQDIC